jgi:hypothetical protein
MTMPVIGSGDYREVFDATRRDLEWAAVEAARH